MLKKSLIFKKNANFAGKNSRFIRIKSAKLSRHDFQFDLNIRITFMR